MRLNFEDHRSDPQAWSERLRVSREAIDLYLDSDLIDLHVCTSIWHRFGYDIGRRHRSWIPGSPFLNQVDLPRAREAAMNGLVWDLTTNPFRRDAAHREATAIANIEHFRRELDRYPDDVMLIRSRSDYERAKAEHKLGIWMSIQGGNALDATEDSLDLIPDDEITRITLIHFTRSKLGHSSADVRDDGRRKGLTDFGRGYVRRLAEKRILVDLAHIHRTAFFDALEETPSGVPVIVSHTGVHALCPVFRNIDDDQIRAIADTGGTIGIMYQSYFLGGNAYAYRIPLVVDHMEHVIRVVGDDFVSLGSDYDGGVILPLDMRDITEQPKLVAEMLARGWSDDRIRKILGSNYLRVVGTVRP